MSKDREAKYEQHVRNMFDAVAEHERAALPTREDGESARNYMRRLRKHTYNNARFTETWQQLQKEKSSPR